MKKILAIIFSVIMCAAMTACGGDESGYTQLGGTDSATQQQQISGSTNDFSVTNKLGDSIKELYVSQSGSSEWGENLLGNILLESGVKLDVSFTGAQLPSSIFDIAVVMNDGKEHHFTNIDVSVSKMVELQMGETGPVASMQPVD